MSPARQQYQPTVTYSQAHLRLKKDLGCPAEYLCLCGEPAREWAYMGGDPNELISDQGRRYSLDQSRYVAMCFTCHRRRDRALADGRTVDVCPRGHAWTPENTGIRRKRARGTGLRFCKACHRENDRARRRAARQAA